MAARESPRSLIFFDTVAPDYPPATLELWPLSGTWSERTAIKLSALMSFCEYAVSKCIGGSSVLMVFSNEGDEAYVHADIAKLAPSGVQIEGGVHYLNTVVHTWWGGGGMLPLKSGRIYTVTPKYAIESAGHLIECFRSCPHVDTILLFGPKIKKEFFRRVLCPITHVRKDVDIRAFATASSARQTAKEVIPNATGYFPFEPIDKGEFAGAPRGALTKSAVKK